RPAQAACDLMARPWQTIGSETVISVEIFELSRRRCRSPRTGTDHDFYILSGRDWCNVVPVTPAGEGVMIRQFRHGAGQVTLEIPGGVIDSSDGQPIEAARRELLEETGYESQKWRSIGTIDPNPAIQTNHCHTFAAYDVILAGDPALDPAEDISVVLIPLAEI